MICSDLLKQGTDWHQNPSLPKNIKNRKRLVCTEKTEGEREDGVETAEGSDCYCPRMTGQIFLVQLARETNPESLLSYFEVPTHTH